jgi:hypothetical protein
VSRRSIWLSSESAAGDSEAVVVGGVVAVVVAGADELTVDVGALRVVGGGTTTDELVLLRLVARVLGAGAVVRPPPLPEAVGAALVCSAEVGAALGVSVVSACSGGV